MANRGSLPAFVFDHFRDPRNRGVLEPADAVGRVEARVPEGWVTLYLRMSEAGAEVRFDVEGSDRSCFAGLSMLTEHISGMTQEQLESVTVEQLAAAFRIEGRLRPLLVPGVDVLRATLANLRGEPDPFAADGEILCKCLHVRRGRIERVIRERTLKTVEDVRLWTQACAGCRSCACDIEALLPGT